MQLLRQPPHAPIPRPKDLLTQDRVGPDDALGTAQESTDDPDAISQKTTIGRMVDRRLDHRAIHPQLSTAGQRALPRELHDPFVDLLQRLGLDEVGQGIRVVSSGTASR